jgi:hypothetical protein
MTQVSHRKGRSKSAPLSERLPVCAINGCVYSSARSNRQEHVRVVLRRDNPGMEPQGMRRVR